MINKNNRKNNSNNKCNNNNTNTITITWLIRATCGETDQRVKNFDDENETKDH